MTASRNINAYADCRKALDTAIANDGCILTFPSRGAALNFRQRCYSFRRLITELHGEGTAYDSMKIATPTTGELTIGYATLPEIKSLSGEVLNPDDAPSPKMPEKPAPEPSATTQLDLPLTDPEDQDLLDIALNIRAGDHTELGKK
jgi:hypothetical protein